MNKPTVINKIAPKSVVGDKKFISALVQPNKPPVPLFRVIGLAHSYRSGEHATNGIWHGLIGQFKATNLLPEGTGDDNPNCGKEFRAGECFLPAVINNLYVSNLLVALEENKKSTMQIACQVEAIYSEIGVGYEYVVTPLLEHDEASDPLAALEKIVNAKQLPEANTTTKSTLNEVTTNKIGKK